MKFNVNITGEFNNIKGLVISQKYYLTVECGSCRTTHKKLVFISDEMEKKVKVKEVNGLIVKYNLTLTCDNCKGVMGINICEPENKIFIDEEKTTFVHPVINNSYCHVSTIHSDSAVIKDVDGLILDAVSMNGEIFRNCDFDHHILAEERKMKTIDITRFEIKVMQIQ